MIDPFVTDLTVGEKKITLCGDPASAVRAILPTGETEENSLRDEWSAAVLGSGVPICLVSVPIRDWDRELSPWEAPAVFGGRGFGSGAADTLRFLTDELLPELDRRFPSDAPRKNLICGYSLAGLFALWSVCRTEVFSGAAAVSPSVWFPGWEDFSAAHPPKCAAVYLSLGDREERAKNPRLAAVGDCIRAQYARLCASGVRCTLEMNPGNHFVDFERRMAKAVVWLAKNANADSDL